MSRVATSTRRPPEQLVLEITESVFSHDRPAIIEVLAGLRATGIRISINDFGTGCSALSYLRDLPVDELKVDRAFIAQLEEGDRGLISTILQLARDLSLDCIAEGIETEAQADRLRELGCDVGQGYLLGHPGHCMRKALSLVWASRATAPTSTPPGDAAPDKTRGDLSPCSGCPPPRRSR